MRHAGVGADRIQQHRMPLDRLIFAVDVYGLALADDGLAALAAALDRHPFPASTAVVADAVGCVTAIVNGPLDDRQLSAVVPLPGCVSNPVKLVPDLIALRIAMNLPVAKVPALLTAAPAPESHHDALTDRPAAALHVNACGDHQHAIRHAASRVAVAGCCVLSALGQALGIEQILQGILPGLGGPLVHPAFQEKVVRFSPQKLVPDLLPHQPPVGRIPARQMKPRGLAIALGGRLPFSARQHGRLVVLGDSLIARWALTPHITIGTVPYEVLPAQHLQ